LRINSYR